MAEFTSQLTPISTAKAIVPVAKDPSKALGALSQGFSNAARLFQGYQANAAQQAKAASAAKTEATQDVLAGAFLQSELNEQTRASLDRTVEVSEAASQGGVDPTTAQINLSSVIQQELRNNPDQANEILTYIQERGIDTRAFQHLNRQRARQEVVEEAQDAAVTAAMTVGYEVGGAFISPERALELGSAKQQADNQWAEYTQRVNWAQQQEDRGIAVTDRQRTETSRMGTAALGAQFETKYNELLAPLLEIANGSQTDFLRAQSDGTLTAQLQTIGTQITAQKNAVRTDPNLTETDKTNLLAVLDNYDTTAQRLYTGDLSQVQTYVRAQERLAAETGLLVEETMGFEIAMNKAGFLSPDVITQLAISNPDLMENMGESLVRGWEALAGETVTPETQVAADRIATQGVLTGHQAILSMNFQDPAAQELLSNQNLMLKHWVTEYNKIPPTGQTVQMAQNFLNATLTDGNLRALESADPATLNRVAEGLANGIQGLIHANELNQGDPWQHIVRYNEETGQFEGNVTNLGVAGGALPMTATAGGFGAGAGGIFNYGSDAAPEGMTRMIVDEEQTALINRALDAGSAMMVKTGLAQDDAEARFLLAKGLVGERGNEIARRWETGQGNPQMQRRLTEVRPESDLLSRPNSARGTRLRELQTRLDEVEGRGDYNKLFNDAELGEFANQKPVTQMTLNELREFSTSGGYGEYVRGLNQGVTATPVGRYQIVNTTLNELADQLGLDGTTVFTPEVQDLMFETLYSRAEQRAMNDPNLTLDQALAKIWVGLG